MPDREIGLAGGEPEIAAWNGRVARRRQVAEAVGSSSHLTPRWSKGDSNPWSLPHAVQSEAPACPGVRRKRRFVIRDREFESPLLQQRVVCANLHELTALDFLNEVSSLPP